MRTANGSSARLRAMPHGPSCTKQTTATASFLSTTYQNCGVIWCCESSKRKNAAHNNTQIAYIGCRTGFHLSGRAEFLALVRCILTEIEEGGHENENIISLRIAGLHGSFWRHQCRSSVRPERGLAYKMRLLRRRLSGRRGGCE